MFGRNNWQKKLDDWSTADLISLVFQEWRVFAFLTTTMVILAGLLYTILVPYNSNGSLVINDSQNSSLQAFTNNLLGVPKTATTSKKGNNPLNKHLDYLRTNDFFKQVVEQILAKESQYKDVDKVGYEQFKNYFGADLTKPEAVATHVAGTLNQWAKLNLSSDFEMTVGFSAPQKELSYFLSNRTLEVALHVLKDRELQEMSRMENMLVKQQEKSQKDFQELNAQLAKFQNRPENVMSLTSREKIGDYLSDLMVRINETDLKIAENRKIVSYLNGGNKKKGAAPAYGTRSQVDSLNAEIELLQERRNTLQVAVNRLLKQSRGTPETVQMVEDLKNRAELEFTQYKEATQALAKVEVQKASIDYRFEVLERARIETTKPAVALASMILLAILLAQIIGSTYVYVRFVMMSDELEAQYWSDKFAVVLAKEKTARLSSAQDSTPDNLIPMHPLS